MPRYPPSTVLLGNTAGQTLLQGIPPSYFSGGPNVTLSGSTGTAGGTVVISAAAGGTGGGGIALAAGTQTATTNTVLFANSNGVSFGMDGSSQVTATVKTDYLTTAQPPGAYLTTARASTDAVGLNTAGTNVTWTVNSSGVSLNAGAYLTTARASNDAVGLNTAGTNVTWTVNSSGISLDASRYAGTAVAQTNASVTLNSVGISISVAAPGGGAAQSFSAGTTSYAPNPIHFSNSNGVSFGFGAGGPGSSVITGSVATAYVGLATTQTNVTWTVNSAGISLNASGYAGTTTAKTGPVSVTLNTAGVNVNVQALGTATAATNVTWTANTNGVSLNAAGYAGTGTSATNASITLNSNGLAISVAAPGGGGGSQSIGMSSQTAGGAVGGTSGYASGSAVLYHFVPGSNITMSQSVNGSSATLSVYGPTPGAGGAIPNYFAFVGGDVPHARALITNVTALTQRPVFFPFNVGGTLSAGEIHWTMSRSTAGSNNFTMHAGIYSYSNSSRIDLISSTSWSYSNTATGSVSGVRGFEGPMPVTSLGPGQYVLGVIFSATATASMNYSLMGGTTSNFPNSNVLVSGNDQYHTYTSHAGMPFWGRYTTTTGAMPASVPLGDVIHAFTGASMPLPALWNLANHN